MIYGSQIGTRFKAASLATCIVDANNKKAIEFAKKIVEGTMTGLILQGPVGTGKTHILISILNDIEAANIPVEKVVNGIEGFTIAKTFAYWKSPDLASKLRDGEYDQVTLCKKAHLLLLDDLGAEYDGKGDFIFSSFQAIFDARWENELPIVVTTNLSSEDMARRYGDRVMSRWRGQCKMLQLKGDDRRKVIS